MIYRSVLLAITVFFITAFGNTGGRSLQNNYKKDYRIYNRDSVEKYKELIKSNIQYIDSSSREISLNLRKIKNLSDTEGRLYNSVLEKVKRLEYTDSLNKVWLQK